MSRHPRRRAARLVFGMCAVSAVVNASATWFMGPPGSDTGFVLRISACTMLTCLAYFRFEARYVRGESFLAFLLVVLGLPALQVAGMVVAMRVGTGFVEYTAVVGAMSALVSVAVALRLRKAAQ